MKILGIVLVMSIWISGSNLLAQDQPDNAATYNQQAAAKSYMLDVSFVKQEVNRSLLEIELGKLAEQKSSSENIKHYGRIILSDHIKARKELKNIASRNNISVAGVMTSEKIDDLSVLNGTEFDKRYINTMIEFHNAEIKEFEDASLTVKNVELKNWVDKTLTTIKNHLRLAQQTKNDLNN
jgi:putative membrane protein